MKLALTVETYLLTNDLYARLSLQQCVCVAVHRLVKPKYKSWVKARWIPAKASPAQEWAIPWVE
jgi:hypothetical protein